jgi:hypothetical protein
MVEQDETPPVDTVAAPELPITFKGREIWVHMPTPEQLLVWKRTLVRLQGAQVEGWNGEQVMRALERTRMIIDSVMVNDVDKEWLDDEMLAGTIGLMDTAQIITMTAEAYADAAEAESNRETRRATVKTPAKKAARKAEPRKRAAR